MDHGTREVYPQHALDNLPAPAFTIWANAAEDMQAIKKPPRMERFCPLYIERLGHALRLDCRPELSPLENVSQQEFDLNAATGKLNDAQNTIKRLQNAEENLKKANAKLPELVSGSLRRLSGAL